MCGWGIFQFSIKIIGSSILKLLHEDKGVGGVAICVCSKCYFLLEERLEPEDRCIDMGA